MKEKFGYIIYSKNRIKEVERKVKFLGANSKVNPITMLNLRLITCISIFILSVFLLDYGYIIGPIITFITYQVFFKITIDRKIEIRKKEIEKDATYFFEVLALSLESGRNIKTALEVTTNNIEPSLSDEFKKMLNEVSFGKGLDEALEELKYSIPSDTVNNIILNIRQSNLFGNSITKTIYQEIDYLREKRLLEAKGEISKIPVKISVISVLFFIPILLLLLLGPLLLELL